MIKKKGFCVKKNIFPFIYILTGATQLPLQSMDNNHFYRASNFWGEPRFEKKLLTSIDITTAGGWSHHGLNAHGNRRCLLETWGLHNIHELARGVPGLAADDPLKQLSALPATDCLGLVAFGGEFEITEAQLSWQQNFAHGFLSQLHVPIRSLRISDICLTDCTSTPTSQTPALWQEIRDSFFPIMRLYGLCVGPENSTGFGDTTALIGWTTNYENTKTIDYADFTLKTGVLFPTGKARNENHPLQLPLGYNKHWAIPVSAAYALGLFEWFTVGIFGDSLFFFDRTTTLRLKTGECQSGLLKLARGCAKIERGALWDLGGYIKIDHAGGALSLILGYTFASQEAASIYPCNTSLFKYSIVNSDQYYHGWNMHTLHLGAEYDLSSEKQSFGPRLGLFYNAVLSGKRVFTTGMIGGALGMDAQWNW